MPAVLIAALFGGVAEGIVVLAVSSFVLFYFFMPPYPTFQIERTQGAVSLSLFVATGLIALWLIRTLNNAVDTSHRLAEEAATAAAEHLLFAELQHRVAPSALVSSTVCIPHQNHTCFTPVRTCSTSEARVSHQVRTCFTSEPHVSHAILTCLKKFYPWPFGPLLRRSSTL